MGSVSHTEKLIAAFGGLISIAAIAIVSFATTGTQGAILLVPSMGAAAVLLFVLPHSKLSQPWPLLGGNALAATVGVSCYLFIPNIVLASAMAVGLAIVVMHYCNCIHPPAGATSLTAVIGGPAIHDLAYMYVLTPVLINAAVLLLMAFIFNSIFPWRRYPASLLRYRDVPEAAENEPLREMDKRYLKLAIDEMDKVIDVSIDDLQEIYKLAHEHAIHHQLTPEDIKLGHYYTNGKHNAVWSIRQIIDEAPSPRPDNDMVVYRVVEGRGLHSSDSCSREAFAKWASREVFPHHRQHEESKQKR